MTYTRMYNCECLDCGAIFDCDQFPPVQPHTRRKGQWTDGKLEYVTVPCEGRVINRANKGPHEQGWIPDNNSKDWKPKSCKRKTAYTEFDDEVGAWKHVVIETHQFYVNTRDGPDFREEVSKSVDYYVPDTIVNGEWVRLTPEEQDEKLLKESKALKKKSDKDDKGATGCKGVTVKHLVRRKTRGDDDTAVLLHERVHEMHDHVSRVFEWEYVGDRI